MQQSRSHYNFFLQQLAYTMQPLQCDLQPQIPKHPTAMHTRRNKHCKTPSRNQSQTKTNGPHPPRTQGTFHRRPKPLYTEKQGFVLRLPPQTKANATLIQPLICVLQQQVYIWLYDVTHTALHECIVM